MAARRRRPATKRALARLRNGEVAYSAARAEGIALSTIYRDPEYKKIRDSKNANRDKV